jgi:Ca2+/H+ antiporter, TMEM165/GDT1 family
VAKGSSSNAGTSSSLPVRARRPGACQGLSKTFGRSSVRCRAGGHVPGRPGAARSKNGAPRVHPAVILTTFLVVFPAELPDKTALAALILGSRYQPGYVFAGAASAFAVHVALAVAAGGLLGLLPHRPLQFVAAALFAAGSVLVLRSPKAGQPERTDPDEHQPGFWRVAATSFAIILAAEFGDLTQVVTATLAASYHNPLSVGVGAVAALWAVAGLAIVGGRSLLRLMPMTWLTRGAATVMLVLAGFSLAAALT